MPAASTPGVRLPAAACSLALVLLSLRLSSHQAAGQPACRFQNVALPELEEPNCVLVVGWAGPQGHLAPRILPITLLAPMPSHAFLLQGTAQPEGPPTVPRAGPSAWITHLSHLFQHRLTKVLDRNCTGSPPDKRSAPVNLQAMSCHSRGSICIFASCCSAQERP